MKLLQDLKAVTAEYYDILVSYLPRLLLGTIVLLLVWALAGRAKRALRKRLAKTMDDPLLVEFLGQVLKVGLIILGLLLFLGIVGLGGAASGLLAGAGVSAFIIGFAFKDIGENFLAGIIMAFDRPFRVGDWVSIGGHDGKIVGLTLRDVHLKTFDGRDIYIPNGMIVRNPIVNYTIDGYLRQQFSIRLAVTNEVDRAISVVLDTLGQIEGILKKDRQSNVFISDYTPSGMELVIQYWLDTVNPKAPGTEVKTQAVSRTLNGLIKEGFHLSAEVREVRISQEK